ncbi:hypothetical protein L208DRAFT_1470560 [Tricholoma matsutake]|nr:hypothetical protein L208DRAFT_1470560 [Tricholoma matsutake 945]
MHRPRRRQLKTTTTTYHSQDWSPFRAAEKRYKARFPLPDLSNVLDFATLDSARTHEIQQGVWSGRSDAISHQPIHLHNRHTKAFIVPSIPGLVVLPAFVPPEQQRELVRWSLADHARFPNETNLDTHYRIPQEGLWNLWLNSQSDAKKDILIQPRASETDSTPSEPPGPRQLINNAPATLTNFHSLSSPTPPLAPSATVRPTLASKLLPKLRWANIGWYYHWGIKQYDFTKGRGTIDDRVRELCQDAVRTVDWKQVYDGIEASWEDTEPDWKNWTDSYEPDAGIVNFYQVKDTLMGHVDRSEVCATSPLVSISLGNAAIFLIGGLTRDAEPTPILLRSGDVVIMSGPECRRAYHGVPRILEGTLPPHLQASEANSDWNPYGAYMRSTRINVNVRQVFPKGFDPAPILL